MKKRIILGIGLLLILLPLITPSSMITTNARPEAPTGGEYQLNDVTSVVESQKLKYNISTFQYGAGIWDVLDLLLEQVGGPSFDKGIIGSLEGSEIHALVAAMDNIPLYDRNETSGTFDTPPIYKDAMSIFFYLKLNNEFGAYINASQFSFPDDFSQSDRHLYNDTWPWADFDEPILDDIGSNFWMGFNSTFPSEFERGFQDANDSYTYGGDYYSNMWWYMPDPDMYGPYDIYWFGYDLGQYLGYEIGFNANWESSQNPVWNDGAAALNGFYDGFFTARTDGFTSGQADFLANRIPDKRAAKPPAATYVEEYAHNYLYPWLYEKYYGGGFMYEGSLVFFNERLYRNLYDAYWDTWWAGYTNGYSDEYWRGQNDGYWDDFNGWGYKANYNPPQFWEEPLDAHDWGYQQGALDGYDRGYDDGYFGLDIGAQRQSAYHEWGEAAYYDGFDNATIDVLALNPYDNVSASLPVPSPITEYDLAANEIYLAQYEEGYDRGFTYTTLVTSPESISWLWSNGPFYNMTLPDAEFSFLPGSILPIGAPPLTMLTDINMSLAEYEFNWDAPYDYWPFSSAIVPMQSLYAIGTDWAAMDDVDVARNDTEGSPGFASTWNQALSYFELTMDMNASEPGIEMTVTWGYNTTTGLLLNVTTYLDFYNEIDMWLDVTLELDATSEVVYTPTMPSPSTWSYYIADFIFYYDIPPTTPLDFANEVYEFKQNGRNSIGNTFLTVNMAGFTGLWGTATMTLQNPSDLADPPSIFDYSWPLHSGGGPVWLDDWNYWDGIYQTANSILGHYDYFVDALNALAIDNYNVDLAKLVFIPELGEYYYPTTGIQYYYVTLQADLDLGWTMLNGEFEWETTTQVGWVNATFYVGIDYATNVVLGGGARASFDFLITQDPDYGFNGGQMDGYIELQIGSSYKAMPDLFELIGHMFPEVPEYGLISLLGIIGLAAVASAVIFLKKKK